MNIYYHTSKVIILDPATDSPCHTLTLGELFHKYSFMASKDEILFPREMGIKIQDMNGWTDLWSIEKIDDPDMEYTIFYLKNVSTVITGGKDCVNIIGKDTKIPMYDKFAITKGYHGESKYVVKDVIIGSEEYPLPDDRFEFRTRIQDGFVKMGDIYTPMSRSMVPGKLDGESYVIKTRSGRLNINMLWLYDGRRRCI